MFLSKKTRYAMMALVRLSKEFSKGAAIGIRDIAESENIPQRFLENILLELKRLGYLGSKLGKSGGYYLLKDPANITLAEVIRHFEGTIALLPCVSEKSYEKCEFCKDESACKIRRAFKSVRDQSFEVLSATTFEDLSAE